METNTEKAKRIIEALRPLQENKKIRHIYVLPCPRCGHLRMHKNIAMNSLSRHANVFICNECGNDEAFRDMDNNPLPLTEWSLTKSFLK